MSILERAIEIAARAHSGQVDKAGLPYVLHPLRMMLRLTEPSDRIVAVLHDVVEDTDWTLEQLREEGFGETVLAAVDALTWRERDGESYQAFVQRAAANGIARRVKLADIEDNLDLSRIKTLTPKDHARCDQYRAARVVLQAAGGD